MNIKILNFQHTISHIMSMYIVYLKKTIETEAVFTKAEMDSE